MISLARMQQSKIHVVCIACHGVSAAYIYVYTLALRKQLNSVNVNIVYNNTCTHSNTLDTLYTMTLIVYRLVCGLIVLVHQIG
jgi:hypothetical protein